MLYTPSRVDAVPHHMWVKPLVTSLHTRILENFGVSPSPEKRLPAPPPQGYIPTLVPLDTLPLLMTSKLFFPALTRFYSFPSLLSSNCCIRPVMFNVVSRVMYTLFLSLSMCTLMIFVIIHTCNIIHLV